MEKGVFLIRKDFPSSQTFRNFPNFRIAFFCGGFGMKCFFLYPNLPKFDTNPPKVWWIFSDSRRNVEPVESFTKMDGICRYRFHELNWTGRWTYSSSSLILLLYALKGMGNWKQRIQHICFNRIICLWNGGGFDMYGCN